MLWELWQQQQIGAAHGAAEGARTKAENIRQQVALDIRRLESRIDSLTLANMAMWELVGGKLGFSVDQLAKKMEEIDLRDGTKDGKPTPARTCSACGRTMSQRHRRCLYCGSDR